MRKDLAGLRFTNLTAIVRVEGCRKGKWICRCDCGVEKKVADWFLIHGKTRSCGCLVVSTNRRLRLRHGHASNGHSPEYQAWNHARNRCYNPNDPRYPMYGGRGITMCERWLDSFDNFLSDMGVKPDSKLTLDRKDNDGNYDPQNCRWATRKAQASNTTRNHLLTVEGKTKTISEWSAESGLKTGTIWARVCRHNWDHKKAVMHQPINPSDKSKYAFHR